METEKEDTVIRPSYSLTMLTLIWGWIFGIACTFGFWRVLSACLFPPYAWIKFAEFLLSKWQ